MTRALIVDKEWLTAADMAATLTMSGHEVVGIAGTAAEALELAITAVPHVAIISLGPDHWESGLDLARTLKERSSVEIMFRSSCSATNILSKAATVRPVAVLPIGASRHELVRAMNAVSVFHEAIRRDARKLVWEQLRRRAFDSAVGKAELVNIGAKSSY
jgi:DNA-binding NarL/FixJ family response regulator